MEQSILKSIKQALGLSADAEGFDFELIMHINSALANLTQLGVGPQDGLTIEDDSAEWTAFIDVDAKLNNAKAYVYLKVRMLFDPPTTPQLISSFEKRIAEEEWRLQVEADPYIPQDLFEDDPDDPDNLVGPIVFYGGGA